MYGYIFRADYQRRDHQQYVIHQGRKKDGGSDGDQHNSHLLRFRRLAVDLFQRAEFQFIVNALFFQFIGVDMAVEHIVHRLDHIFHADTRSQKGIGVVAVATEPFVFVRPSGNLFIRGIETSIS